MKTILPLAVFCLLCGCSGSATPGQYKTKERPSAVLEPADPSKEAKAAEKNKNSEKDQKVEKKSSSEKNPPADKK